MATTTLNSHTQEYYIEQGYWQLACAIMLQAIEDYEETLYDESIDEDRRLNKKNKDSALFLRKFILDNAEYMSNINGEDVIKILDRRVQRRLGNNIFVKTFD